MKKNIAIIAGDVTLDSSTRQILDRFLIGYSREGSFLKRPFENIKIFAPSGELLAQRKQSFPIEITSSRKDAIEWAEAVVCLKGDGLMEIVDSVRANTPVFVCGLPGKSKKEATAIVEKAAERNVPLCA